MHRLFIATPTHVLQGGVERILESLAHLLPKRAFDVTFGLGKGRRFHDPVAFRNAFPVVKGIDVDGVSGTAYGRARSLRRAILDSKADVVLQARVFDVYPVVAKLKREGHPVRLAVTVQSYEEEYFVDLKRYADYVDMVIAAGPLVAEACRRFCGIPAERIRNIGGGVAPAHRYVSHDPGPLRLGYIGRLQQVQKRIYDFPPFVEELKRRGVPYTLDIVGGGNAERDLRELLPGVRFHGWLQTRDLYERIYPRIDVMVHFAGWEGMPIAPREAMAHGVVPVISRFIGLEGEGSIVDGETALTFPVGDVVEAAALVEKLHHDRALLARLSMNARQSQGGIRSEEGAADAWAEALRYALEQPSRIGATLPETPRDRGMLSFLPAPVSELIRRWRPRPGGDPGSEWPHWSGETDDAVVKEVRENAGFEEAK